jgi:hypothetical protein
MFRRIWRSAAGGWLLAGVDAAADDPLAESIALDVRRPRQPCRQGAGDGRLAGAQDSRDEPGLVGGGVHPRSVGRGEVGWYSRWTVARSLPQPRVNCQQPAARGVAGSAELGLGVNAGGAPASSLDARIQRAERGVPSSVGTNDTIAAV